MIRGGHIDATVLGAMEVDGEGSLANWAIPGKKITGMGGAMDLVNGPKQVIVMSYHFNKTGDSKLVKNCTLPLTGKSVVDYVVTDIGVFKPQIDKNKFKILKLSSGFSKSTLIRKFLNKKRPRKSALFFGILPINETSRFVTIIIADK